MTEPDLDVLVASYEAREPRYTERDYLRRFAEIKNARAIRAPGMPVERPPDDWMVALLASGRVTDAEYFRLARMLGVDSSGLILAEPEPVSTLAWIGGEVRAFGRWLARVVAGLRRE